VNGSDTNISAKDITMRNSIILIRALIFELLLAGLLFGQSARVSGQVVDSSQAAVRASQVTLRNLDTDGQFRTTSTERGEFLLPPVPPGRYEISASAAGFATTRVTSISLEISESKVITLELHVAGHSDSTVSAADPLLRI